ncbi:DUF1015 domain-containing protein [Anaeromyxobacter sp. PSR-1]|uniref:DUF1015 domain-containing protein n=1 Tax=unclassified Anaeromyxobacter TaxID=2620896 RepID=UPI0005E73E1D|nr:DUF1015 domain-containing protein [Anaeromyxobacter sp. PSR-1]GAO04433.1 hypothetical protein PSR1_03327 [Anaeromyxobacter sp. PSR-1]
MAEIVPFRGVRYAATRGRALGQLLAPPYDLVSLEQRDELLRRSPENIAHVAIGEERAGDGPGSNKYTRAAELWTGWMQRGVLRRDPGPALYALEQAFWAPDGRQARRRGFLAAVRLHEFSEGVIVPHEKTLTAPRADRLEILKAVRANLSPIIGLYRDEDRTTSRALEAVAAGELVAETDSDDGVHHRLWRAEQPEVVAALQQAVADKRIFIADGHHRYVSGLAYRKLVEAQRPGLPPGAGHNYILMFLCPMSDPGLMLFPTHRLVFGLKDFSVARLTGALERYFRIETLPEDIRRPAGRAWAIAKLSEHFGKSSSFLMVTAEDQKARVLTLRDEADLEEAELPRNETLRALDVTVLHSVVLQHVLGLSASAQENQESLTYVRDAGEAVNRVLSGEHQVGFLVNPTPMWQVEAVGDAGETMPQKSTYFYPRLQSGLVMREVFEPGTPSP